jgi:hypothetical protein
MARVAVFGILPDEKTEAVNSAIMLLNGKGIPFRRCSPREMAFDTLGTRDASEVPYDEKRAVASDVSLKLDLISLASDTMIEVSYSFLCIGGKVYGGGYEDPLPYEAVHDKAIGCSFRAVFNEEYLRKCDAVVYLDTDADTISGILGISVKEADDWKMFEKYRIRSICRKYEIMYSPLKDRHSYGPDLAKAAEIVHRAVH